MQGRMQCFRNTEVQKLSLLGAFGDDNIFKTMSVGSCIQYLSSCNT